MSLCTLAAQGLGFATQVVIAAAFGARADMDAFLAATTLPQYVTAVVVTALSFVFIPVFIDYSTRGKTEEAWHLGSAVVGLTVLALGTVALAGVLLAEPLLRLTTPGLSGGSLATADRLARITWPSIAASGLVALLAGIYQAHERFAWQALVPALGAGANLLLVVLLVRPMGIEGVALAAVVSAFLQAVLLLPIVVGRWRWSLFHPGVAEIWRLALPLIASGVFVRWTPVVDRYLASGLAQGSIAHLGYAFKLVTLLSLLLASGIATVVFPRMSMHASAADRDALLHTTGRALRVLWLGVAPVIAIGIGLAEPVIGVLFQRGAFVEADTRAVAGLLRVYLVAMIAMSLGNVTGRCFYALKRMGLIAVLGVIEGAIYAVYTPLLARWLGAVGVALAFAFYYNVSLTWQLLVLRHLTVARGGLTTARSFLFVSAAASLSGVIAWLTAGRLTSPLLSLILGGGVSIVAYVGAILWLGPEEARKALGETLTRARRPAGVNAW